MAIIALSTEFQPMMGHLEARLSCHSLLDVLIDRFIDIENSPTLLTPEVVVALTVPVEPVEAAGHIQIQDLAFLLQQLQVAVNSSQTYVRDLLSYLLMDPVRCGMRSCRRQDFQDGLPLS